MRTGYEKGYEVITLSDCVAATSEEEYDNAIRFDYPMFSDVMTSEAFAEALRGAPAAAGGSCGAGGEGAFAGFDGGWSYGQPYIVVLRRGGPGVTYAFASRRPLL